MKSWKAIVLAIVAIDFTVFSIWALATVGWSETWTVVFATAANTQVALDLSFAVAFAVVFLWRDARANNINPVPFVLVSLFAGSIGLMAYGVRRLWLPATSTARAHLEAARA